jgi:hypothetical protein
MKELFIKYSQLDRLFFERRLVNREGHNAEVAGKEEKAKGKKPLAESNALDFKEELDAALSRQKEQLRRQEEDDLLNSIGQTPEKKNEKRPIGPIDSLLSPQDLKSLETEYGLREPMTDFHLGVFTGLKPSFLKELGLGRIYSALAGAKYIPKYKKDTNGLYVLSVQHREDDEGNRMAFDKFLERLNQDGLIGDEDLNLVRVLAKVDRALEDKALWNSVSKFMRLWAQEGRLETQLAALTNFAKKNPGQKREALASLSADQLDKKLKPYAPTAKPEGIAVVTRPTKAQLKERK